MRHTCPKSNWPTHLARVLAESEDGDEVVVPDKQILGLAVEALEDAYPEKRINFVVASQNASDYFFSSCDLEEHPVFVPPTIPTEDFIHMLTLLGEPPTPDEIQRHMERHKQMQQHQKAVRSGLQEFLDSYLREAEKEGGQYLADRIYSIVEELSFHVGACFHLLQKLAETGQMEDDPAAFLASLEQASQSAVQKGDEEGYCNCSVCTGERTDD